MFCWNSGILCPAPLTQYCPVDCVGSWGACAGGPPQFKTYTWTTPPLNGGSAATCGYPNGQTDGTVCLVCMNVPSYNDVRFGTGFGGFVNLMTGQSNSFYKAWQAFPGLLGCRRSWQTRTCQSNGTTLNVIDPTCGGGGCNIGNCSGCPPGTENDCI